MCQKLPFGNRRPMVWAKPFALVWLLLPADVGQPRCDALRVAGPCKKLAEGARCKSSRRQLSTIDQRFAGQAPPPSAAVPPGGFSFFRPIHPAAPPPQKTPDEIE